MKILAITLEKCSGCAILIDDKIVFSSSEERYTRIKSDSSYPRKSIQAALDFCNLKGKDFDKVLICGNQLSVYAPLMNLYSSLSVEDHLNLMKNYWYPKLSENKNVSLLKLLKHKIRQDQFPFTTPHAKIFDFIKKDHNFKDDEGQGHQPHQPKSEGKIVNEFYKKVTSDFLKIDYSKIEQVDHHTCHAYYAFYGSPVREDNTLVVTADAWGDDLSGTVSTYNLQKKKITRLKTYKHTEFQLARIYRFTTLYLRMLGNEHEYKVMGLAPYYNGEKMIEVKNIFEELLTLENIEFKFNPKVKNIFDFLEKRLFKYRFDHIAAGLQKFTEDLMTKWFSNLCEEFKASSVVFSGGASMNVKANMQISKIDKIKNFFVCGSGSDETLPIGACYYWNEINKINSSPVSTLYLGDDAKYQDKELEIFKDYKISKFENYNQIISNIEKGKIICTCRGRMEMGQRSLGNRSILADPRKNGIVKKINESIKQRDFWMPFAPIILSEYQDELIENNKKLFSPFMTIAFDTINGKEKIPAAIHQSDGTARAQLLDKNQNQSLWNLIFEFYKKTKIPALLNTSFNLHGYPIVRNIKDALFVFKNSDLDVIWLDNHIIEK